MTLESILLLLLLLLIILPILSYTELPGYTIKLFFILLVDYTTCGKKDDCCAKKWSERFFCSACNIMKEISFLNFDQFICPKIGKYFQS